MSVWLLRRIFFSSCFSPSAIFRKRITSSSTILFSTIEPATLKTPRKRMDSQPKKLLVHWRGEDEEGYSISFRQPEFLGALSGLTKIPFCEDEPPINFRNALNGEALLTGVKLRAFNEALQWISLSPSGEMHKSDFTLQMYISTAQRSALVANLYEVICEGDSLDELSDKATENGGFNDMMVGGENEHSTWAVRVRQYGGERQNFGKEKKERRHSDRMHAWL